MISECDLLSLRYQVVTRLKDSDNSVELIHQDFDERGYLVKLRNGEVSIIFPTISSITKQPCFRTNRIEELMAWHNHY